MPSSLATSGTVAPAASFASAWRSLRTICSGECRLPIKSPPYARLGLSDSHSNWTRFWGAGHRRHGARNRDVGKRSEVMQCHTFFVQSVYQLAVFQCRVEGDRICCMVDDYVDGH